MILTDFNAIVNLIICHHFDKQPTKYNKVYNKSFFLYITIKEQQCSTELWM